MTDETLEQERHAVGRVTRVFPEIVITEEDKEGAAYLGVLPHHADYQSELRTQCRERQLIATFADNERLRQKVKDWAGMYRIAASRAEAAEASNAELQKAFLWLREEEASLRPHREGTDDDGSYAIWWNVEPRGKRGRSLSGHPLASPHAALLEGYRLHLTTRLKKAQGG